MFQADYRRDLYKHYLIIQNEIQENQYSFRLKMLINNKIPGILNFDIRTEDNIDRYFYDITSKQSIANAFQKSLLSYMQVKKVIRGILSALELGSSFLLNEDDFVLDPTYVYLQLTNHEVYLCYVLEYKRDIREQFTSFIEFLMDKVDYTDDKAVLLIYGLYKISREKNYSFEGVDQLLEKGIEVTKQKSEVKESPQQLVVEENQKNDKEQADIKYSKRTVGLVVLVVLSSIALITVIAKVGILNNGMGNRMDYKKALALLLIVGVLECYILNLIIKKCEESNQTLVKKEEGKNKSFEKIEVKAELKNQVEKEMDEELKREVIKELEKEPHAETIRDNHSREIFIDDEKTTVLNDYEVGKGYMLTSKNKESYQDIRVKGFPFVLGKLISNVDYVIDDRGISRIHARIDFEKERIYIMDLNSTNGTFVNNERLELHEKRELMIGDEIMLANVKYCFCMV